MSIIRFDTTCNMPNWSVWMTRKYMGVRNLVKYEDDLPPKKNSKKIVNKDLYYDLAYPS